MIFINRRIFAKKLALKATHEKVGYDRKLRPKIPGIPDINELNNM